MNLERRQSPRQHIQSLVYVDLEPSNGGILLDLSEGGMQISVANRLAGSGDIRFSFSFQEREQIQGTGSIAWVSASGKNAGVRFVSLPQSAREQIRKRLAIAPTVGAVPNLPGKAPPTRAFQPAGENPSRVSPREDVARDPEPAAPKETNGGNAAQTEQARRSAPPRSTPPAPPPPWLEALIRAGQRHADENMSQTAHRAEKKIKAEPFVSGLAESAAVSISSEARPEKAPPSPDSSTALYLPNYQAEEDRKTGDVRLSKFDLRDSSRIAVNLAFERLEEFGWTLESDWHIWVALILLAAGFLALTIDPSLVLLAIAFWVVSAVAALKRKERPRPAEKSEPDPQ